MSRSLFHSHNKVGETMSFQTNSSSATTFGPTVTFLSGVALERVSWDLGDGSGYQATNNVSYTYSDGGITKTATIRTNKLNKLKSFNATSDNLVGHLDMSKWDNLGTTFSCFGSSELTGVTHTASTQIFTSYRLDGCDITGVLDVSMLSSLGGSFFVMSNSSLTNILHTYSPQVFSSYRAFNCDLTGNLNLPFPNLGGNVYLRTNSNLTGVTHTASTQTFTLYQLNNCNITGKHNLPFSNFGGQFSIHQNSNLTEILHSASTQSFSLYSAYSCNLTGTHDMSMLTGLGGQIRLESNSNLTNISLPATEGTFANINSDATVGYAIILYECDFEYLSFLPLSGANMDVDSTFGATINIDDQNMSAGSVNHILVDFREMSTNLNPSGWSGVTLHIAGNNPAPDNSSGGYDGIAALAALTGSPNNWTITTS